MGNQEKQFTNYENPKKWGEGEGGESLFKEIIAETSQIWGEI